ncbi:MAG: ABC transporter substrate-binding protein [Chloroflexi bacterium]|nr:ABC transporter substrate-binding protein [Chloroflexota bacterium]
MIKEVVVEKEVPVTVISRPTNTPLPVATPGAAATPAPGQQPVYGSHINMRAYADTKDWDPLGSSSLSSVISYSQLYNQLVQFDTVETDKVVCDLCSSWEISNGGQTFTFRLNENIKWHDGEDLTAEDVVFSLSRYYDPDVSPGRSGLSRNYVKPLSEGGLKAIDRNTVEFNLQFPSSAFIKFLSVDYAKILPKHLLEQDIDLNQGENVIEHNSGSGPFMLTEYKRGNFYKVIKNPNYFKEGRPFFGSIDHFIIVEAARFISALKVGQVDMSNAGSSQLTPKQNEELIKDTNSEVVPHAMSPGFNVGLMINVKKKPFDDPRVRRAIYLAIDRQQINDIVLDGTGGETTIFMPGMAYTEEEALTWPGVRPKDSAGGKEDLAEAKKLMAEAGFPDGFKTKFDSRKVSYYSPVCQIVKEQLKDTLGIEGDLQIWESAAGYKHYGTARAADAEGDWELACQGEGMLILDADAVFGGVYRAGGTRNYTDWTHPTVEALFEKQKVEFDLAKRREILRETADFLRGFEDNHWVTLVWGRWFWQVHRDIKGFNPPKTVQYGFKHEDLWLDR